jgi:biopolymer transport protein ExbB/TolQ
LYRTLKIVEGVAPGLGFLGTCISLISTMHHMDPKLTQSAMLKVLLDNSSSAFGSTVYGISLAITAFLALEIFRGFLIKPGMMSNSRNKMRGSAHNTESIGLTNREA